MFIHQNGLGPKGTFQEGESGYGERNIPVTGKFHGGIPLALGGAGENNLTVTLFQPHSQVPEKTVTGAAGGHMDLDRVKLLDESGFPSGIRNKESDILNHYLRKISGLRLGGIQRRFFPFFHICQVFGDDCRCFPGTLYLSLMEP